MLQAGQLRSYITITQPSTFQDASGQENQTETVVATGVPARVQAVAGGEVIRGVQVQAGVTTLITTRFRSDIEPPMKIIHDNRTLNVVRATDPAGTQRELSIQCNENA